MRERPLSVLAAFVCVLGCSSSQPPPAETNRVITDAGNADATDSGPVRFSGRCSLPFVLRLTVTGFTKCSCLNGSFALTKAVKGFIWSSSPITGCPGQSETAFFKFSNDPRQTALAVTSADSEPGSGNSNYSPADDVACSPVKITGAGSDAGNITAFCPGDDDRDMKWSIEE